MAKLRDQIEFYPPGLIVIRGPKDAARFLHELPEELVAQLMRKGYCFFVLPKGISLEAVPDEALEQAFRARQRARKPVIRRSRDGMN